jgi:sulfotransferase family protein
MSSAPAAEESPALGVPPVLVGGVPRSGTHIVAHLIGSHASYFVIPYEVMAQSDKREGLVAYLNGSIDRDELVEKLRTVWWRRPLPWRPDLERGLFKLISHDDLEAVLDVFRAAPPDDRLAAARALADALFAKVTAGSSKPGWVDHSPWNISSAPDVLPLFPDAKFIHVVRDGRDRAASVVRLPWGAESFTGAVRRWGLILRKGEEVAGRIPPRQFLVLHLEDLVLLDRERSYERLLEFLELSDDPAMRAFFESEVSPERAHLGRWQVELSEAEQEEVDAAYRKVLAELRAEGISCAPPDRELGVAYGASAGRSTVDPWADGLGEDI